MEKEEEEKDEEEEEEKVVLGNRGRAECEDIPLTNHTHTFRGP